METKPKFKVGDKVKCKNSKYTDLDNNVIYTVEAVEPIWLKFKEEEYWWWADRFEKVRKTRDL